MAKIEKTLIESRNGYDIELVKEEVELAGKKGKPTTMFSSYRVLTSSSPRRIVGKRITSVAEAQKFADSQPKRD